MTEQDLVDLKAYLDTVPPVAKAVPAHELRFPFGFRPLLKGWRLLFFHAETFEPDPAKPESWNRGAYIVNGPGHCGECHTPRNALGAPERDRFLAGNPNGPDGKAVPNITPNPDNGIGEWSQTDITFALQTGILPDGDVLGGAMAEVVEDATSHLTPDDRAAIAEYLLSLPPLEGAAAGGRALGAMRRRRAVDPVPSERMPARRPWRAVCDQVAARNSPPALPSFRFTPLLDERLVARDPPSSRELGEPLSFGHAARAAQGVTPLRGPTRACLNAARPWGAP